MCVYFPSILSKIKQDKTDLAVMFGLIVLAESWCHTLTKSIIKYFRLKFNLKMKIITFLQEIVAYD